MCRPTIDIRSSTPLRIAPFSLSASDYCYTIVYRLPPSTTSATTPRSLPRYLCSPHTPHTHLYQHTRTTRAQQLRRVAFSLLVHVTRSVHAPRLAPIFRRPGAVLPVVSRTWEDVLLARGTHRTTTFTIITIVLKKACNLERATAPHRSVDCGIIISKSINVRPPPARPLCTH